ncbi:trypsin-like serine peptidase [Dactylosporangium sp. CA-233914]|uniref:trypsin-like serine peptidase n=1 Tax=Dactylosporangium sp. CA-233914 TaxID=3239934 RepID=UPI003D8E2390
MHLLRIAIGVSTLVAVAVATPGVAGAAPSVAAEAGSVAVGSDLVPVFDPATRQARMATSTTAAAVISAYWTPERIAAAKPVTNVGGMSAPDRRTEGKPQLVAAPTAAKADLSLAVAFTNTEGRVFYRDPADGLDHACSAGAVNSGKRRLVLTAGHCVYGNGGWMENWVFKPGYNFGAGSAGIFPAFQLWAQGGWINNRDRHYDYAFAITQNNSSGQRIVDAVGGNGLQINPGRPFITFIGYPSNVAGGEQQASCQGQLSRRSITNSDQKLNCNLGTGSSGGPWLRDFANGLGIAVSNTSYGINPDPQGPVFGPYYDGDTLNLYNAAENASP